MHAGRPELPQSSDPLILTVAPNGARRQPADHPALPLSPETLADTARRCLDAGAAMLHLHLRDAQGRHSLDVEGYREALRVVRSAVGEAMVLQVTSEAAQRYRPAQQIAMLRTLRPEALSVALRELDQPEIGDAGLAAFFHALAARRAMTQVILYDLTDLQRWQALRRAGTVPEAPWFLLFVLGRHSATHVSDPRELLPFVQAHDGPEAWATCAFGPAEHACVATAAALGGHVRVGFENNLHLRDGTVAPDNAALVRQVTELAGALGRKLASAAQIRERFGA
ncbi:3-keto-5-aminohexanoate cleavage protein [Ideonella sp.]|uniref:3-keto-5-aminohexanoate cleavage protein n=1 Tax=Ideonella sp. TaxID=1929293 RepID=UPI0035B3CEDD